MRAILPVLMLAMVAFWFSPAAADDRHAGYYYPEPTTTEVYPAKGEKLPDSTKRRRIGFIVALTDEMLERPYPPDFAVFAKGEDAEKLLIVALRDGVIDNLYRARAMLAQLTAVSRGTELFQQLGVEESFTFFDLLFLLGFERITVSDGKSYAHQVDFE